MGLCDVQTIQNAPRSAVSRLICRVLTGRKMARHVFVGHFRSLTFVRSLSWKKLDNFSSPFCLLV